MVFYVIRKFQPPARGEERHGPYDCEATARAKALALNATKPPTPAYQVVCDYG